VALLIWAAPSVVAQNLGDPKPSTETLASNGEPTVVIPTKDQLLQKVQALEQAADPNDESVVKIKELYDQAIRLLDEATGHIGRANQFQQLRDTAPQRLEDIKTQLGAAAGDQKVEIPEGIQLAEAKQAVQESKLALDEAKALQSTLEEDSQNRAARRLEIPKQLTAATQRLDQLKTKPVAAAEGEDPRLVEARSTLQVIERHALGRQVEALNLELSSYEARGTLLTTRRDLAALRTNQETKRVEAWQAKVNSLNEAELIREREAVQLALREAARQHPSLVEIAKHNEALVAERAELSTAIERLAETRKVLEGRREAQSGRLSEIKARFEATGRPSETFGLLLLKVQDELPDLRVIRRSLAARREVIEHGGGPFSRATRSARGIRRTRRSDPDRLAGTAGGSARVPDDLARGQRPLFQPAHRNRWRGKRVDAGVKRCGVLYRREVALGAQRRTPGVFGSQTGVGSLFMVGCL
jgi:hypothetical protein